MSFNAGGSRTQPNSVSRAVLGGSARERLDQEKLSPPASCFSSRRGELATNYQTIMRSLNSGVAEVEDESGRPTQEEAQGRSTEED